MASGWSTEEKEKDHGVATTALGVVVAGLAVWGICKWPATALAVVVAGLAAWGICKWPATALGVVVAGLAAWGICKWPATALAVVVAAWGICKWQDQMKAPETYFSMLAKEEGQGVSATALAVGVLAGLATWGMCKWLGSATTLVVGVAAWGIFKWLDQMKAKRQKEKDQAAALAVGVAGLAAVGVAGLAAWGICKSLDSSDPQPEEKVKMMKAPGRDGYIPRPSFEESPKTYFRHLRHKY